MWAALTLEGSWGWGYTGNTEVDRNDTRRQFGGISCDGPARTPGIPQRHPFPHGNSELAHPQVPAEHRHPPHTGRRHVWWGSLRQVAAAISAEDLEPGCARGHLRGRLCSRNILWVCESRRCALSPLVRTPLSTLLSFDLPGASCFPSPQALGEADTRRLQH